MDYSDYLLTDKWLKIRKEVLFRDSNKCRVCNMGGLVHVHHRAYPKVYGTEPLTDLITLCKYCHDLFHGMSAIKKTPPPSKKKLTRSNDPYWITLRILNKLGKTNPSKPPSKKSVIDIVSGKSGTVKKDWPLILKEYAKANKHLL